MKRKQLRMSSFTTLLQHAVEVPASAIRRGKEMKGARKREINLPPFTENMTSM